MTLFPSIEVKRVVEDFIEQYVYDDGAGEPHVPDQFQQTVMLDLVRTMLADEIIKQHIKVTT
jgi:hypothetical protein